MHTAIRNQNNKEKHQYESYVLKLKFEKKKKKVLCKSKGSYTLRGHSGSSNKCVLTLDLDQGEEGQDAAGDERTSKC